MPPLDATPLSGLLDALAAKTPAPGGGAAASVVGALGAALGRMVVAYSEGKASLSEHAGLLADAAGRLDRAREVLLALGEEDAAAYAELNALMKRPPADPERQQREPAAVEAAVGAPRAVVAAACDLLRLLEGLVGRSNPHLRSDLAIAAVLAEAAAASGAWNVRVNLPLLKDEARRGEIEADAARSVAEAASRRAAIEAACAAGG